MQKRSLEEISTRETYDSESNDKKTIWDNALRDATFLRQVRLVTWAEKKLLIATTMEYKATALPTEHPTARACRTFQGCLSFIAKN